MPPTPWLRGGPRPLITYAVGQSEGRAVLDAARAAASVPGAGLSPSGPVGVFGYSQGGQAAA